MKHCIDLIIIFFIIISRHDVFSRADVNVHLILKFNTRSSSLLSDDRWTDAHGTDHRLYRRIGQSVAQRIGPASEIWKNHSDRTSRSRIQWDTLSPEDRRSIDEKDDRSNVFSLGTTRDRFWKDRWLCSGISRCWCSFLLFGHDTRQSGCCKSIDLAISPETRNDV